MCCAYSMRLINSLNLTSGGGAVFALNNLRPPQSVLSLPSPVTLLRSSPFEPFARNIKTIKLTLGGWRRSAATWLNTLET